MFDSPKISEKNSVCYALVLILITALIHQITDKGIFGKLFETIINNTQYIDAINTVSIVFAIPIFILLLRLCPRIIKMAKI